MHLRGHLQYDIMGAHYRFSLVDVPKGAQWGSRPSAHRWLGRWQADRTLDKILTTLIETADLAGLLNGERLARDVFFPEERVEGKKLNMDVRGKGR